MVDLHWKTFDPATLQQARSDNQLILLLITVPWCAHCKDLLRSTFRHPDVIARLESEFVTVQVDAERRPDVNERFGTGGWPTIAYLTPEGELIANDTFLTAAQLLTQLDKVRDYFREHPGEIEKGLRKLWSHKSNSESEPNSGRLSRRMVEDIVDAIYEKFDHRYGGWGESSKFPHPEAIDFALVEVVKRDDSRMREVITLTLDRMLEGGIHDIVDGGFFRFSKTPDWRNPNFEKTLDGNAWRLRCYLEAYQVFENQAYRRTAEGIVSWMTEFMVDEATGAFFGSQDADADYYVLGKEERRNRKPPKVDETIYANWNAIAVSVLLKASIVLDRPELRDRAMRVLSFLLENLFNEHDGVFHYWDGTYHLPGMLSDQAFLIRALIDASQSTGNADFLQPAETIAEKVIAGQKAPGGGFYDILHDSSYHGSMRRRNRSILENAVMAESLVRLSYLSHRPEFHDEAVQTLEAFANDYKEYGYYVAGYGRAVDLILYEPLTITIIGDRESQACGELRRTALTSYVPSRIVQTLDPARDPVLMGRTGYPTEDRPSVHLSVGKTTKAIVHEPDELRTSMEKIEHERRSKLP